MCTRKVNRITGANKNYAKWFVEKKGGLELVPLVRAAHIPSVPERKVVPIFTPNFQAFLPSISQNHVLNISVNEQIEHLRWFDGGFQRGEWVHCVGGTA